MAKGQPKARPTSLPSKTPRAERPTPESSQNQTPVFCFRHTDTSSRNEWKFDPDSDSAPVLLRFFGEIGRSTWAEIQGMQTGGWTKRHRKHHEMPIGVIEREAQEDIKRLKLDETFGDEIYRFRIGGKPRLWGFRVERTFHVVWWDPNHKVYETDPD